MHPQMDEYIKLLKQHDWTYEYSDDHRAWSKGKNQRKVLRDMAAVIDPDHMIWNEHCMHGFQATGNNE